jgi:hypothetical protein
VELIDRIPGRQTDRKTPLGELNWIFTAITDTIAWNILPRALFQRLFRQDLLVASLFRNFLLAERIMRANHCTPISIPALPPTHQVHIRSVTVLEEGELNKSDTEVTNGRGCAYVPASDVAGLGHGCRNVLATAATPVDGTCARVHPESFLHGTARCI